MNHNQYNNPQKSPARPDDATQQGNFNNPLPGQPRGDDQERPGESPVPNPDPTYEPERPQPRSENQTDGPTQAGIDQNFENDALYSQDDYATFEQRLNEFDLNVGQQDMEPGQRQTMQVRIADLRNRLNEARERGGDCWNQTAQALRQEFDQLDQSRDRWPGQFGQPSGRDGISQPRD